MKSLLFDQNLSPRLVNRLADLYPGSTHVETAGLETELDKDVWEYARKYDFIIITKDVDFSELELLWGFPPKVIWIRRGNCSTSDIEHLLRESYDSIKSMSEDPDTGILTLF
jgi:predicted nuclease of predicted toxin-antitoxin system